MSDGGSDRMKAYIAEQTGLPVETIEAVLEAHERFWYRGWRAPVTAAEEADRAAAVRIASTAARSVTVGKIEEFLPRLFADVDLFVNLVGGVVHVRLADRSQWICSAMLYRDDGSGKNQFLQRLDALTQEHRALRGCNVGPRRLFLIRQETLDPRHVFCIRCRQWYDLQADA